MYVEHCVRISMMITKVYVRISYRYHLAYMSIKCKAFGEQKASTD